MPQSNYDIIVLTDDDINKEIDGMNVFIQSLLRDTSFNITPVNEPGLGNLIGILIRTMEQGLIMTLKPFGYALDTVISALPVITIPQLLPAFLLKDIADKLKKLLDISADPIGWLIKQLTLPLYDLNIYIPIKLPGLGDINIGLSIDDLKLSDEAKERVRKQLEAVFNVVENTKEAVKNLAEDGKKIIEDSLTIVTDFISGIVKMLMLPVDMMIGLLNGLLEFVIGSLNITDIFKLPKIFLSPEEFLKKIVEIVSKVVEPIIISILPISIEGIKEFLAELFALFPLALKGIKALEDKILALFDKYRDILKPVLGPIATIISVFKWFFSFVPTFPIKAIVPILKEISTNPLVPTVLEGILSGGGDPGAKGEQSKNNADKLEPLKAEVSSLKSSGNSDEEFKKILASKERELKLREESNFDLLLSEGFDK